MRELIKRLIDQRANEWEAMKAVLDRAEAEKRDLDAEEQEQAEKWTRSIGELDARIEEMTELDKRNKAIDEQRKLYDGPEQDEPVPGAGAVAEQFRALARGDIREFEIDLTSVTSEINPQSNVRQVRDLSKLSAGAGGDLVPTSFVRRLYEHVIQNSAIRRTNVTVVTTASGENLEFPKTTAFASAALTAEVAAIAESDPAFAKVALGSFKYAVATQASFELLEDNGVDLEGFLARDLGRACSNAMGTHFVTGDGSAKPLGIVTASTLGVTGGAGVSGAFTADNLIDLYYSVIEDYAARGWWMMRRATEGAARKLKGSDNNYLWQPGLQVASPNLLLGQPIVNDPNMAAVALSARSVIFGDFSAYIIRDVGSVRIARSDDFAFLNDLATFKAVWRSDGDLLDTTGAVKHFIGNAA